MTDREQSLWWMVYVIMNALPMILVVAFTLAAAGVLHTDIIYLAGWWFLGVTVVMLFALLLRAVYLAGKLRS